MLLRLEAIHVDRQFCRRDHVREKDKLPAGQLRAVAEIEILRQRVVLPASRFDDAGLPPKPGGAVEIEKAPAPAACRLLEEQMPVEEHRLHTRQQRIAAVQMPPARLEHANSGIGKMMDRAPKKIARRDEVRVENPNELARRGRETLLERTGFE